MPSRVCALIAAAATPTSWASTSRATITQKTSPSAARQHLGGEQGAERRPDAGRDRLRRHAASPYGSAITARPRPPAAAAPRGRAARARPPRSASATVAAGDERRSGRPRPSCCAWPTAERLGARAEPDQHVEQHRGGDQAAERVEAGQHADGAEDHRAGQGHRRPPDVAGPEPARVEQPAAREQPDQQQHPGREHLPRRPAARAARAGRGARRSARRAAAGGRRRPSPGRRGPGRSRAGPRTSATWSRLMVCASSP